MLPPGLGLQTLSRKRPCGAQNGKSCRAPLGLEGCSTTGRTGFFPYTRRRTCSTGCRESLKMLLDEEGLPAVSTATPATPRRPVARSPAGSRSAVRRSARAFQLVDRSLVPSGFDADRLREIILEAFDMSLGTGLGSSEVKSFASAISATSTIWMLSGTLAGVEMGCTAPAFLTGPVA